MPFRREHNCIIDELVTQIEEVREKKTRFGLIKVLYGRRANGSRGIRGYRIPGAVPVSTAQRLCSTMKGQFSPATPLNPKKQLLQEVRMPIPRPNTGEEQGAFISRCASKLVDTDPDRPQAMRMAMCYTAWRRAKGVKQSEVIMPEGLRFAFFSGEKDFGKVDVKVAGVKLYRKNILKFGKWVHPENKDIEFEITPDVVQQIANNFNAGVPHEAPVVLTHTDDPKMKVGGIKTFIPTDKGLDCIMSVDDDIMNTNIESKEKTPGVSCWLDLSYKDKQNNEDVGAVVKHVALVNHPYIEGLRGFEAVSLSEGDAEEDKFVPLILSEKKTNFKKDDMPKISKEDAIKALKDEHEIDVTKLSEDLKALNEKIKSGELVAKSDVASLSEDLLKKIAEVLELDEKSKPQDAVQALFDKYHETINSDDKGGNSDDKGGNADDKAAKAAAKVIAKEKAELNEKITGLQDKITEMDGEKQVGVLLSENKILPAEKEVFLTAFKENRGLFDKMVESRDKPLVELVELGEKDNDDKTEKEEDDAEIKRQSEAAKEEGLPGTEGDK